MADAYARMSRAGVAAVSLHQGCGLTNALTGITEAAKSRTPLVVVTAEATQPRSNFFVDQPALARAVGAVPMRVESAAEAPHRAAEAVATAVQQRRTVLLNLPLDVQTLPATARRRARRAAGRRAGPGPTRGTSSGSRARCAAPAGRCSSPDAARAGRAAGRRWSTSPTAAGHCSPTSAVAKGLFPGNPWSLGRLRRLRLAAGRRADRWRRPRRRLGLRAEHVDDAARPADRPGATVVQVDDDADALGAHRELTFGVLGDVGRRPRALRGSSRATRAPATGRRGARADRHRGPLAGRRLRRRRRAPGGSTRAR